MKTDKAFKIWCPNLKQLYLQSHFYLLWIHLSGILSFILLVLVATLEQSNPGLSLEDFVPNQLYPLAL